MTSPSMSSQSKNAAAPGEKQGSSDKKVRVMVVDDSAVIRGMVTRVLESDKMIEVVSSAPNGQVAVNALKKTKPQVIILDIEMPVMDGLTALPLLLEQDPDVKVLIFSTLSEKGATISMRALSLGASECLLKPTSATDISNRSSYKNNLIKIVKALANNDFEESGYAFDEDALEEEDGGTARDGKTSKAEARGQEYLVEQKPFHKPQQHFSLHDDFSSFRGKPHIIAIGSSTGGPQALFKVIRSFRAVDVPIVITQHMPPTFTKILAQHISQNCFVDCVEGEEDMALEKGRIYLAPGGKHMQFVQKDDSTLIKLNDGPKVNFCKPSVDMMLDSIIKIYKKKALGIMLTGMGNDGLNGFRTLVNSGGRVIAQNEKSSVVWGMPGAVAKAGLCSAVLPIDQIGPWALDALAGKHLSGKY